MKITNKAYTVASVLDVKIIPGTDGILIYWARVACGPYRWVIGRAFKTPGNLIPPGTPYFGDFDKAYKGWQRQ